MAVYTGVRLKRKFVQIHEVVASIPKRYAEDANKVVMEWELYHLDPQLMKNLSGLKLGSRTGRAKQAVGIKHKATLTAHTSNIRSVVGFNKKIAPYLGIQDQGGRITPKNKRYLAVPTPDALSPRNYKHGTLVKPVKAYGKSTFALKVDKPNLPFIVLGPPPGGGKRVPLFLYREHIDIKPTYWAKSAIDITLPLLMKKLRAIPMVKVNR